MKTKLIASLIATIIWIVLLIVELHVHSTFLAASLWALLIGIVWSFYAAIKYPSFSEADEEPEHYADTTGRIRLNQSIEEILN